MQIFSPPLRKAVIIFLFTAALGIRLYHLFDYPLDYHPSRQYHSAILARNFYFQSNPEIPDWRREVARINAQRLLTREPRLFEFFIARIYCLVGEHLWIPRLISILFWLAGGAALYLVGARLFSRDASLLGLSFYLFTPYGIISSRSFQPNPLAMMLLLLSIMAIIKYMDLPDYRRLLLAAALSALTLLIRPPVVFTIIIIYLVLLIGHKIRSKAQTIKPISLFFVITLFPTLIYYGYLLFITDRMADFQSGQFMPSLLLKSFFWEGWFRQIMIVLDWPGIIIFLSGFSVIAYINTLGRRVILSLFVGYILIGFILTYAIYTHVYYSQWLVPIVALLIGGIFESGYKHLKERYRRSCGCVFVLVIMLLMIFSGIWRVKDKLILGKRERLLKMAVEIGELVQHSTKTVFISRNYGKPLLYHGELSGLNWPRWYDFRARRVRGEPVIKAEDLFQKKYAKTSPEYFIITVKKELDSQKDLKEFLVSRFPVIFESGYYIIFDLRNPVNKIVK